MIMIRVVLMMVLILPLSLVASDPVEKFDEANRLYDNEQFEEAITAYSDILETGYHSPEVYFNLGNCHYKSGELALAVLNYERARKLNPSEKQILKMLSMVREEIDSEIIEVEDFLLLRYWNKVSQWFKPIYWMFFQFVFGVLMLYGIYQWKLASEKTMRVRGLIIGVSGFMIVLFCYLAGAKSHRLLHDNEDAIVMQNVELMSGPESRSEALNKIVKGEKVKVLDKIENWYKVQLMNKEIGWISIGKVEFI